MQSVICARPPGHAPDRWWFGVHLPDGASSVTWPVSHGSFGRKVFRRLPRGMEIPISRVQTPRLGLRRAGASLLIPDLTMRGAGGMATLAGG